MSLSSASIALVSIAAQRADQLLGDPPEKRIAIPETDRQHIACSRPPRTIDAALIRRDYRLRGDHNREIQQTLERWFERVPADGQQGDLILCAVRFNRPHFAIHCGQSFIHADARLRRVAETPGLPGWPILAVLRPIETHTS